MFQGNYGGYGQGHNNGQGNYDQGYNDDNGQRGFEQGQGNYYPPPPPPPPNGFSQMPGNDNYQSHYDSRGPPPPPPPPHHQGSYYDQQYDNRGPPPPPPPPNHGSFYQQQPPLPPRGNGGDMYGMPAPPPPPHHQGGSPFGSPPMNYNHQPSPHPPGHNYGYQDNRDYQGYSQSQPPPPAYSQTNYGGNDNGNWGAMVPTGGVQVFHPDLTQYSFTGMDFPSVDNYSPPPPPPNDPYYSPGQPSHGNIAEYNNVPGIFQQQSENIQLSNCLGRKRALLIGINYIDTPKHRLRGCINDVHNIKQFLIEHFRFKESDMVILTDDQKNPNRIPNYDNIIRAMKWLVADARMNDSFFFHYSGHGTTVKDKSGDEIDGNDEVICPSDFTDPRKGYILDDTMNDIMVKNLPPGVRLTAIFDCCHSATALDLPFMYDHTGKLKNDNAVSLAGKSLKSHIEGALSTGDLAGVVSGIFSSAQTLLTADKKIEQARQMKSSMGDVIMFSGCKDTQTSADVKSAGADDLKFVGAMSHAFIESINANPHQTYVQLLQDIRRKLKQKNYTQIPQLSSGRMMNMNTIFIM
ncbi:Ca(2+)-dependent cysteine protease [Mycoemilia scoparia]|uniref:Ca(2+)-dependent cysteine protease n=1 Tax=Mycoemilia scoparia TaxID=417184 RepID=A0A9W8A7B4_9FUNG|nr:Ca(2+)-dependent cysteine protease [Mycoemilia scoparia]